MNMHTPAEVVTALRALADDFSVMEPTTFPDLAVSVSVQVCGWSATTDAQRIEAVDAFAVAAAGTPGVPAGMANGSWHHTVDHNDGRRQDGLRVAVLTSITPDETHEGLFGECIDRPGRAYRVARIGTTVATEVGYDKAQVTSYGSVEQARAGFAEQVARFAEQGAGVAA